MMVIKHNLIPILIGVLLAAGCGNRHWFSRKQPPIIQPIEQAAPLDEPRDEALVVAADERAAGAPTTKPAEPKVRTIAEPADVDPRNAKVIGAYGFQVNNTYITIEELLSSAANALAELPPHLSEDAFRRQALWIIQQEIQNQIRIALIYDEAQARLADGQKKYIDDEIQKTLQAMVAEAGGSKSRLEQIQIERGTTLDDVLREQRRRMTVDLYMHIKFKPLVQVSRSMLLDYYNRNAAAEYSTPARVSMQLISVPISALAPARASEDQRLAARSEARGLIDQAKAALDSGESFGAVAKRFSKGPRAGDEGVWPMMEAGNFKEEAVEKAAFSLQEGQVSGIIETPDGFYIVKALKVEPAKVASFEQAQAQVEKALTKELYAKLDAEYISKKSKTTTISFSKMLEELALQKAIQKHRK
ncbi:MAG: peptidyl-prolyl cis-trans isomerase [Planctomycetes bacterium]|jgi:parvulin-like peptidyl-prolyl isomerase|nr:peptidyl-prolyl cis-trans isomerase [Planctomycetota bacterium]